MPVLQPAGCHLTECQGPKVRINLKAFWMNINRITSSTGYVENGDRRGMRDNPHKYLLYKPSLSQLMVFLSSGFKELPPGGALLLYMSADGCFSTTKHPQDCMVTAYTVGGWGSKTTFTVFFSDGYELGGLATSVKRDAVDGGLAVRGKSSAGYKEPHCLYPGDLYPYTRRPLFIIIDSDNSFVFQHIPRQVKTLFESAKMGFLDASNFVILLSHTIPIGVLYHLCI